MIVLSSRGKTESEHGNKSEYICTETLETLTQISAMDSMVTSTHCMLDQSNNKNKENKTPFRHSNNMVTGEES